ncbi:MAG: hypothetical protein JWN89_523 [Parcubacteria group bacterium]|nr:hypothetical protein [Parcubacteria group bacterium]
MSERFENNSSNSPENPRDVEVPIPVTQEEAEKMLEREISLAMPIEQEPKAKKDEAPAPEPTGPELKHPHKGETWDPNPAFTYSSAEFLTKVAERQKSKKQTFWGKAKSLFGGSSEVSEGSEESWEDKAAAEIEAIPAPEREKIGWGLNRIGFNLDEKKNRIFAGWFNSDTIKKIGEDHPVNKWCGALRDSFTKDADAAYQKGIDAKNGKTARISNALSLAGNVMKYGRIAADFAGNAIASPLRYVMLAGAGVARGGDAALEVRLQNEEVIEQTRLADVDKAEEEAWNIYTKAEDESQGHEITAEDLKKAYTEKMPKDLMERLGRATPAEANKFVQGMLKREVSSIVESLEKKISKIENNPKLSPREKETKKQALFAKQEKTLQEFDKIVTQYGTVDGLAMAARYARFAGKTLVAAATVETITTSFYRLWENLAHVQAVALEARADLSSVDTAHTALVPEVEVHEAVPEAETVTALPHAGPVLPIHEAPPEPAYKISDLVQEKVNKLHGLMDTKPEISKAMDNSIDLHEPILPLSEVSPVELSHELGVSESIYNSIDPEHTSVAEALQKIADASASDESVKSALALETLKPAGEELSMTIKEFLKFRLMR